MAKAAIAVNADRFEYVAVGPHAFGFGDTKAEAVRNCSREIPWSLSRKTSFPVSVYAYRPEQEVSVSHFDGSLSWNKPDLFDVEASLEEVEVKRPRNY